ncbi:MAG: amidohydrolase family protein [Halieaceae bacterium]
MRTAILFVLLVSIAAPSLGENRLPILDMHMHAYTADAQGPPPMAMCTPFSPMPAWDPGTPYGPVFMETMKFAPPCDDPLWSSKSDEALLQQSIEMMERFTIVSGVLSGPPELVARWREAAPGRFIPGLGFNLERDPSMTPDVMRALVAAGSLDVLAEVTNQYSGIAPNDDRMEPYWALAEELDLPVGIHVGTGPPGFRYISGNMLAKLNSPLTIEPLLLRHPGLRIYLMHAGFPHLEDLLSLLYVHPQVYVDIAVISVTQSRPAFYRFLQGIVEGGFGNRVMFGSDQMVWPGLIERTIAVIEEAPFLTDEQKRDIFYNNAARFLRLTDEEIAQHHGR